MKLQILILALASITVSACVEETSAKMGYQTLVLPLKEGRQP
jgi:hypothetical protein